MNLIVRNIKLSYKASKEDAKLLAKKALLEFFSNDEIIDINISKRSVDARNKDNICFVYSFKATIKTNRLIDQNKLNSKNIVIEEELEFNLNPGNKKLEHRPVVVGFGPAGMFCAYLLTLYGYKPIVIERGEEVRKRKIIVDNFYKNKVLDENTNIQFGAGGAGTFSDGKLMTRINNSLSSYVIDVFHKFGAGDSILYEAKPHIGSDVLVDVVDNLSNFLINNGCEIHYNTRLTDIVVNNGEIKEIETSKGNILTNVLVLALGHSARDTLKSLRNKNLYVSAKPFSVGCRIEHLQEQIDYACFGDAIKDGILPHAEYSLSTIAKGRGVYTFCMCPGGVVVPAMSNSNTILTNGMSNSKRDGMNANSAICCSITLDDVNNDPDVAEDFISSIEKRAFGITSSYMAPSQTVGSFLNGKNNNIKNVKPTYMDGYVQMTDISKLFNKTVSEALKIGLHNFGKRIKGFDYEYAILTAPETRTSSPVKIDRNDDLESIHIKNVYPCGEGAGYAGGITSAAIDGLKCAQKIINKYRPIE